MSFLSLSTAEQSRKIDDITQKKFNLSAEVLMESAGAGSAEEILKVHPAGSMALLCGPGHNGGDGLVLARHLHSAGCKVQVFCAESRSELAAKQKKTLKLLGLKLFSLKDIKAVKESLKKSSLIVDALFGVGLNKNISGIYLDIIKHINNLPAQKISLDAPSGLNVDTGQIMGAAVKADHTLTFGLSKPGFYLRKGRVYSGKIVVKSLCFPLSVLEETAGTHFLVTKKWVSEVLPSRQPDDHKARQGHLLVLAGRPGFLGAGLLCAEAGYRMGAGYVTWAGQSMQERQLKLPDVLTKSVSDKDLFQNKTAAVIGPGLGVNTSTKNLIIRLKKEFKKPVVVDADAFTVCVKDNLFPLPKNWVLTPHSGELGKMFDLKGGDIDKDPCGYALKAGVKAQALVLLKGLHSVLSNGEKCWIIPTGNAGLAKAGSGDVLAGFIGALTARGLDAFSSALAGAFVHGGLADYWLSQGKDQDSLMAQDLKDLLPFYLKTLRKKNL